MPGVIRRAAPRPEHALLVHPGRDLTVTAATVLLTMVVLVSVSDPATLARLQRLDDGWLRLMIANRSGPVTALAELLDVLGSVLVMLPVRIVVAGWLALRRRWWHLVAFVAAVVVAELLIGTLKDAYDRGRPPGALVTTSGASFPSGHAVAASVTVFAGVIVLLPPGRVRARWGAVAAGFAIVMALSRAYLGAHWLSDALAGVLVGASCALLTALVVGALQRRRSDGQGPARPEPVPALSLVPSEDPR